MVGPPGVFYRNVLKRFDGGSAHFQGLLHRYTAVHLRIRRSWRNTSETSFCWGTCDGMGYSPCCDDSEYGSDLYVPTFSSHP